MDAASTHPSSRTSSRRWQTLIICALIFLVAGLAIVSTKLVLLNQQFQIATSLQVNKPIESSILEAATSVTPAASVNNWDQYHVTYPGEEGRLVTVSFFGGAYLYIAVDTDNQVVDFYWYRT